MPRPVSRPTSSTATRWPWPTSGVNCGGWTGTAAWSSGPRPPPCPATCSGNSTPPPACSPPRPFDAHAFAAFDRAYRTLATPFESLVEGYALVLAFALSDPLTHPPAVLLEDKRTQPKPPDQRNEPVEEAEELVGWQFVSPQVEALAAEATDRGLPRLAVLAQWMAASTLTQVPLPPGPVPRGYFAVTGEVTFAVGLRLRHVHPALAAELAEELFRHNRRRAKLGGR